MPGETESVAGLLLSRELSGERHLKLALLSGERGLVSCLLRVSARSTTPAPDLFDLAEVSLERSRQAGPRFAGDYRIVRRLAALGSDYQRLSLACRLALFILKNPPPDESAPAIYALCLEAAQALAERPRPDAALFKFLWQLARTEGYPVREQWLPGRTEAERTQTVAILRAPLDGQTTPPGQVALLTRSLERWFAGECQFMLPE